MNNLHARGIIAAVVLLALAVAYNAAVHRYSVTTMGRGSFVRIDHLTGKVETCSVGEGCGESLSDRARRLSTP